MPQVPEAYPGGKDRAGGGHCGCLGSFPRQPLAQAAYAFYPHSVEEDGTGGRGSTVPARESRRRSGAVSSLRPGIYHTCEYI